MTELSPTARDGPAILEVYFGQQDAGMLLPHDNLMLVADSIFAADENSLPSTATSVEHPAVIPQPVVLLNAPTFVGSSGDHNRMAIAGSATHFVSRFNINVERATAE